jgi:hypothetical protein
VWKYAGPKVLQTATLLAVYRGSQPGQGSVVDPSEYTAGTAVDSVSGAVVATVNFTREQLDFQGRPYVIEADYTLSHGAAMGGGTSYRAPANEIARLLALYGISIDTTTFGNVASTDTALSFLLDGLYGSRDKGAHRIGRSSRTCSRRGARGSQTTTGAWAIIQDTVKASTWQFDAAADQSRSTHTATATSRRPSRSRTARERAASRTTRDSSRGPRPARAASSSSPTRTSAITRSPIASSATGRSGSTHCASGGYLHGQCTSRTATIDIADQVTLGGTKKFIATQITRPADRNVLKLREYDPEVYTYTAGHAPRGRDERLQPRLLVHAARSAHRARRDEPGHGGRPGRKDHRLRAYPRHAAGGELVADHGSGARHQHQRGVPGAAHPQRRQLRGGGERLASRARARRARLGGERQQHRRRDDCRRGLHQRELGERAGGGDLERAAEFSAPGVPDLDCGRAGSGSTPVLEYNIQRKVGAGSFADYSRSSTLNFIDDNVAIGTAYQYKIQAIDRGGNVGTDSNTASITPQALIADFLITSQASVACRSRTPRLTVAAATPAPTR